MDSLLVATRWDKMQELFEDALRLGEADWTSFLDGRCGSDSALADQVHQLLVADRHAADFLEGESLLTVISPENKAIQSLLPLHGVLCGRFELLACLGEGGMGQVYEAMDLELKLHIAIKAIRPEIAELPGVLSRFKREVLTARRISHPNVCKTFDLECHVGQVSGRDVYQSKVPFLTMELLRGQTLAERIKRAGPIAPRGARQIALQLASALCAAHEVGVVHCDLKPSNIFLTGDADNLRVAVTDFGIARIIQLEDPSQLLPTDSHATVTGPAMGTPDYMAPEQFECGRCTPGSDVYSFALILFEALTGERLHPLSRSPEGIQAKLTDADRGYLWGTLLSKCLQVDPRHRFPNMKQVLDALESMQELPSTINSRGFATASARSIRGRLVRWVPNVTSRTFARRNLWATAAAFGFGVAAVVFWGHRPLAVTATPVQSPVASVAVLPFDIPGGEAELKPLGQGIAGLVTNDLARFTGITVPSQAALASLGAHPDLREVRQRLHVDNVVNGSITKTAQGFLLQIALVDAKNAAHRWGGSYARAGSDTANLDEDISVDVAYLLRRDVHAVRGYAAPSHTSLPTAQEAFRKGEAGLKDNSDGSYEVAAGYFQQAIDADPDFSQAYERLANCYLLMANNYLRPEASTDLRAKAESLALHSVELKESSAAFTDLAKIQVFRRFDWKHAEENAHRSVQLDPNNASAHAVYAFYVLMPQMRFAEARAQLAYMQRTSSENLANKFRKASGDYFARNFEYSLTQALQLKKDYPTSEVLNEVVAEDYLGKHDLPRAIDFLRHAVAQSEDGRLAQNALLGVALARSGRRSEAARILGELAGKERFTFGLNFQLAALAAALGDRERALAYLTRAEETRETSVLFLKSDALMDPLRSDSRFQHLLLKMNLNDTEETGGSI